MVAIITARGGSKRIPNKNIRDFCGKPILSYSIATALESGLFEEVMVSTDSEVIADVALNCGAKVPFMRSPRNSDDFAGTADVIAEVLESYRRAGRDFAIGCCLYPTAPLLTVETLRRGYDLFCDGNYDVVFPVLRYSYPIQRSLRLSEKQQASMLWPENYSKRSQDLEPVYHDAGQFYWFRAGHIAQSRKLFGENCGGLVIDDLLAQDIDHESDWQLAEFKFEYTRKRK